MSLLLSAEGCGVVVELAGTFVLCIFSFQAHSLEKVSTLLHWGLRTVATHRPLGQSFLRLVESRRYANESSIVCRGTLAPLWYFRTCATAAYPSRVALFSAYVSGQVNG